MPLTLVPATVGSATADVADEPGLSPATSLFPGATVIPRAPLAGLLLTRAHGLGLFCSTTVLCSRSLFGRIPLPPLVLGIPGLETYPAATVYPGGSLYPEQ